MNTAVHEHDKMARIVAKELEQEGYAVVFEPAADQHDLGFVDDGGVVSAMLSFARRLLADLRHDPVYAGFLYPDWRAADETAATAAARADAEAAARAQLEAQLRETTEARARAEAELERLQSAAGGAV